jgi:hypothetical protein
VEYIQHGAFWREGLPAQQSHLFLTAGIAFLVAVYGIYIWLLYQT